MSGTIYRTIIEHAPFGCAIIKIDYRDLQLPEFQFMELNRAFELITGLNGSKITGKCVSEITDLFEEHQIKWLILFQELLSTPSKNSINHYSSFLKKGFTIQKEPLEDAIFSLYIFETTKLQTNDLDVGMTLFAEKQKEKDSQFLNQFALRLAELPAGEDSVPVLLPEIKQHTGAVLTVFNRYDAAKKVLIVSGIEVENKILKKVIGIAGERIMNTESPVSEDVYQEMIQKKVGFSHSLTNISFGAISPIVDHSIRRLIGISQFVAIAHFISGELYGTTMLAFKKHQPLPDNNLLKSFADMASLSLRRNIAEKTLMEREAGMRKLLSNISDVIFTSDLNLNITYISPSSQKVFGESPEVHLKKKLSEKLTQDSLSKIYAIFALEMENEKEPFSNKDRTRLVELSMLKADKSIIQVSINLSFIRDSQGQAIGIQGIIRDITGQKQAEEALKKSEEKFRHALKYLGEGVCIVNNEEYFILTNPAAEAIFEIESNQLINRNLKEFLSPENILIVQKETEKRSHGESSVYELEIITAKNNIKNILVTATAYNFGNQGSYDALGVFRDITDIKKSEKQLKKYSEELQQLNADKDRFLQIISHDLKNPFNTMLGFSELLLHNLHTYDTPRIENIVQMLNDTAERTLTLLEELLLWSKSQSGKLHFEPQPIKVDEICHQLILEVQPLAVKKNISITFKGMGSFELMADKNMMRTILRNVLSNAIKFSNNQGIIEVFTSREEHLQIIRVKDYGIGMDAKEQAKLWNFSRPFTKEGTANEHGTGLGLLICKEFVDKHHGKIDIKSEPGIGTEIIIKLPIYQINPNRPFLNG